ncbi:DUF1212-domain-containing protein [Westerdykella ornata]|uniref:DUF1212-domain-containing protein n=1 Tax=Westerdykella ornata TaxID=318751 RepID=A0A6A6JVC4_WESOR|nr:DUF1212-domain-containing protein [Westerdykella ornata]KAF2279768.1 DUF1212-domain-containing protein [Westerdykella ornata]
MEQAAESLEIKSQFLYMPNCMIMAFDDPSTHTSEVRLIRTSQGVELDKLLDVYQIYKAVSFGDMPLEEATELLEEIIQRKAHFNRWLRVFFYGLASATVGPFAFEARPIEMPACFALGCSLGFLQLIVVPHNELMGNMFEIIAAFLTSFVSRALGSIQSRGHEVFCFSAMAQSSIALILPGYIVLCASLELQARQMVPGSVRMVYALIYSFILGFGIMLGSAVFGSIYQDATSATRCENPLSNNSAWNYLFVFLFSICLTIINQARLKQMPTMVGIAMIGYAVSFNTAKYVRGNSQVSSTVGAFAIGVTTAMIPAIFVQVPSGLSVSGSLVSGIISADQMTRNATGSTIVSGADAETPLVNNVALKVGFSVIQVAIGITVGLFVAALVTNPFGRRRRKRTPLAQL